MNDADRSAFTVYEVNPARKYHAPVMLSGMQASNSEIFDALISAFILCEDNVKDLEVLEWSDRLELCWNRGTRAPVLILTRR